MEDKEVSSFFGNKLRSTNTNVLGLDPDLDITVKKYMDNLYDKITSKYPNIPDRLKISQLKNLLQWNNLLNLNPILVAYIIYIYNKYINNTDNMIDKLNYIFNDPNYMSEIENLSQELNVPIKILKIDIIRYYVGISKYI